MPNLINRRLILSAALTATVSLGFASQPAQAADPLKEIRIDWATYNPVSLVLKDQKLLEKEKSLEKLLKLQLNTAKELKAEKFRRC